MDDPVGDAVAYLLEAIDESADDPRYAELREQLRALAVALESFQLVIGEKMIKGH